jgi:hypothetical protein
MIAEGLSHSVEPIADSNSRLRFGQKTNFVSKSTFELTPTGIYSLAGPNDFQAKKSY